MSSIVESVEAYRRSDVAPWSRIGKKISSGMGANEILKLAGADYEVLRYPASVEYNGAHQTVPGRFVTGRVTDEGTFDAWEVVKERYQVVQNTTVLGKALSVVSMSGGEVSVDSAGIIGGGRKFFVVLYVGHSLVGAGDVVCHYLLVSTSHDGTSPITYAMTDVRIACNSVVRFKKLSADTMIISKHTTNVGYAQDEPIRVLGMSSGWQKAFTQEANKLNDIRVMPNSRVVDAVLNDIWPERNANTRNKRATREVAVAEVKSGLLHGTHSAWGLLSSVGHYLDHGRAVTEMVSAQQAMEVSNLIYRTKIKAHKSILNRFDSI